MIKLVCLMKFKDSATHEVVDDFVSSLGALYTKIPTIRNSHIGVAIKQSMSPYTHSWICEFDNVATWQDFMQNPDHRAVSAKYTPIGDTPSVSVFQF